MNKKKTIIILVIGILVVIISSIGVTYSYMKPKADKTNNKTEIGINNCAKITLKDSNSTINLTNMYPMEEEMGLQTTPYEFTVSSTCEEYTGFNLYLTTLNDNEIKDKDIRYAVTDVDNNVLITDLLTNKEEANDLTEEEIKELEQGIENKRNKTYKVYNGVIPLNKDKVYKLHLWIDENANNDTMKQSFKIKVSIKGYKYEGTLAEYLIKTKDRTLIYHDGKPDYKDMENYELEAGDLSYRFTGGNDVVNNYVCLNKQTDDLCSDEDLYRIIGLFKNEEDKYEIKLIRATYATSKELGDNGAYDNNDKYYWNNDTKNNNWSESNLNIINLKDNYYNYLKNKNINLENIIVSHNWIVAGNQWVKIVRIPTIKEVYINEIVNPFIGSKIPNVTKISEAKIGLIYISDYLYGATSNYWKTLAYDREKGKDYRLAVKDNWIYSGLNEWTITRDSEYTDNSFVIEALGNIHNFSGSHVYGISFKVRPCFYLNSNVIIQSSDGTKDNPYRISI